MTCQKFTCTVTLIINAWELAPYFFQTPLPSGKGHAKAFLNRNKNMKNNFCMSRTNARYRSDRIAPYIELFSQLIGNPDNVVYLNKIGSIWLNHEDGKQIVHHFRLP